MALSSHQPLPRKCRTTDTVGMPDRLGRIMEAMNSRKVSNRALAHIVATLEGSDQKLGGSSLHDMQVKRYLEVKETIVLPLTGGKEYHWDVANPSGLVSMAVRLPTEMENAFAQALRWHPCSVEKPWRLVVNWDELTPGNALKPHNSRKCMVTNFSFMELASFGDHAWFTMAVARANLIQTVAGGWSRMLRDLLRLTLGQPSGMQVAGIPLMVKGKHEVIYAKVTCLLSDGDGLRQALQWRGASSNKPCFRHWNVVRPGSLLDGTSDVYVNTQCSNPNRFKALAEGELHEFVDVVVEAKRQHSRWGHDSHATERPPESFGVQGHQRGLVGEP